MRSRRRRGSSEDVSKHMVRSINLFSRDLITELTVNW